MSPYRLGRLQRPSIIRLEVHPVRPAPGLVVGMEMDTDCPRVLIAFLVIHNGGPVFSGRVPKPDLVAGIKPDALVRCLVSGT